jgi:hypothetical protein
VPEPDATCNGVLFALPPTELDRLNWREAEYTAAQVDPATVDVLGGDAVPGNAEIWYYAVEGIRLPNATHPIVQSYVDICIGGCLEIEEAFPQARAGAFARQFIATTEGWQTPWINDRQLPWRPSVYEPRAWDIDDLLKDVVGAELFGQIKVPGI